MPTKIPDWQLILDMAKEWGVPPWEVEKKLSEYWYDRYIAARKESAIAAKDIADNKAKRKRK